MTCGLEDRCSIQLSYRRKYVICMVMLSRQGLTAPYAM
jgi:hypothetical protein